MKKPLNKVSAVGTSREIAKPHVALIGSDRYSKGAAAEAWARR